MQYEYLKIFCSPSLLKSLEIKLIALIRIDHKRNLKILEKKTIKKYLLWLNLTMFKLGLTKIW